MRGRERERERESDWEREVESEREKHGGQQVYHLDRPVSVGLCDAEVDEAGHGQPHEEPVAEAEVVDELEHILHTQEYQAHPALEEEHSTGASITKGHKGPSGGLLLSVCSATLTPQRGSVHSHCTDILTHVEYKGRNRRVALHVDQTQAVWEVSFSRSYKEQPRQRMEQGG